MNGNQQQAYDRGITIFSPDGRLYQVEYAREAVKQGSPSLGVRTEDGVVLVAHKPRRSALIEPRSVEKLHSVDEHVGIASAGHAADARRLVDIARRAAQGERLRYDEPATVESLATIISDHIQEHTQTGGARPYGTALLLGGYNPDTGPRLYETDPSGTSMEWKATAVGRNSRDLTSYFEEEWTEELTLDDGLQLTLAALASVVDDELTPGEIDASRIDADGYRDVEDDEVQTVLDDLE